MYRTRTSNYKLKKIIKHFCTDIDATKTAELLEISRTTINRYFMLFREIIYESQMLESEKFFGEVEVDESYFGARRKRGFQGKLKRGRGTLKQPVFGVLKRDGKVYTQIIPDCTAKTLIPIITGKVELTAEMYSDSWRSYDGLVALGYAKHYRVNHGNNEFAFKNQDGATVTVNGIESFWSFTKRRLAKFNGYSKYLDLHLKECQWRWNCTQLGLDKEQKLWYNLKEHLKTTKKVKT